MSLTNAVRVALVLVDLAIVSAVVVGLVRFHRAGMARVRAAYPVPARPGPAVSPDELVEAELARSWSYGPEAEARPWWRP